MRHLWGILTLWDILTLWVRRHHLLTLWVPYYLSPVAPSHLRVQISTTRLSHFFLTCKSVFKPGLILLILCVMLVSLPGLRRIPGHRECFPLCTCCRQDTHTHTYTHLRMNHSITFWIAIKSPATLFSTQWEYCYFTGNWTMLPHTGAHPEEFHWLSGDLRDQQLLWMWNWWVIRTPACHVLSEDVATPQKPVTAAPTTILCFWKQNQYWCDQTDKAGELWSSLCQRKRRKIRKIVVFRI